VKACARSVPPSTLCAPSVRRAHVRAAAPVSRRRVVSSLATLSDLDRTGSAEVDVSKQDVGPERLHLVLAWSADQPELVGHSAPVDRPCLLGRGGPLPDDPAPRATFVEVRPSGLSWGPPLQGVQLSRRQILLAPALGGLAVKSIGRHPLFLNGEPVAEGLARPGDTLRVLHSLVLIVVARPPNWWFAHRGQGDIPFPFGAPDAHRILGECPAMWKLREAITFAAQSRRHVLVLGESGSGKELVARAVHALSARAGGPFVARNAATLPEGLVDAELFGNVRGYPHAGSAERPGLIGEADGGTLFLDEMAELRHDLQAHLLRVLDGGGEYQRLGDARARRADVRLVAATNRPVSALKHDLAARFTIRVQVPGLNERREDIPLLLRQLLAAAVQEHPGLAARFGGLGERDGVRLGAAVDAELVEALLRHRYTHHVRELNQLLWLALSGSPAGRVVLTPEVRAELGRAREGVGAVAGGAPYGGGNMAVTVPGAPVLQGVEAPQGQGIERHHIEAALARTGGKVAPAARMLGLKNRYALYRLMERHGIRGAEEDGEREE
jgi:DNA-binding NtrC family response regulator